MAGVGSILEAVAARFRKQERAVLESYSQLVRAVAENRPADPDEAAAVLERAGKTPEALAADVEVLVRRLELKAKLERVPALEQERGKIEQAIAKADEALQAATAKHRNTVLPLGDRLREVIEGLQEAEQAKDELFRTCRDEGTKTRYQEVSAAMRESERGARDIRYRAEQALAALAAAEAAVQKAERQIDGAAPLEQAKGDLERARTRAAKAKGDVQELEKGNAAMAQELDELRERMITS